MKFNLILLAAVSTILAANIERRDDPKPSGTPPVEDSEIVKCIKEKDCKGDSSCLAKCANVPNPTKENIQATNKCVSECDPKNTEEYLKCTARCINGNYLQHPDTPSQSGSAGQGSASQSGKASGSAKSNGFAQTPSFLLSTGLLASIAYFSS